MEWHVALGVVCLGLTMGAILGWYVNEAQNFGISVVKGALEITSSIGLLIALQHFTGKGSDELWLFPIALFVSFSAVTAFEIYYFGYDGFRDPDDRK